MEGTSISYDEMPNTLKNYYLPTCSDDDTDDGLIITERKPLKRAGSNNCIDKFFDEPKTKKQKQSQSSTVGQARVGGMSYISTNVNDAANATHLIKLEVYEIGKLAKVPANKRWKHADARIKFYTNTSNGIYEQSKKLIYSMTKDVAESQDCKKYFFNDQS